MTNFKLIQAIESGNLEQLADVNDWAVNSLRDFARARMTAELAGQLNHLIAEEAWRIDVSGPALGLHDYLRCSRVGSRFLLNRAARRFVWTIVLTRRAIKLIELAA